ncbi:uncharacterized protein LOC119630783 [Bombyx mori]|uniref:DUF6451 domain-containing protein n=1 Tax=Bombyx mori TaxID=7091 RepID=A0A8R2RA70_BOMMO|nr:uncharacterized protein LOC119630783 [Bombyx mori]
MWTCLKQRGIPNKIIGIIQALYGGSTCGVVHDQVLGAPIEMTAGVKQGCLLSPLLFIMLLDDIMWEVVPTPRGIEWSENILEDLDYADDSVDDTDFGSNDGSDEDIEIRNRKARGTFAQLKPVWESSVMTRRIKLILFDSIVKSVLLFGCETWRVTKTLTNRLQQQTHSFDSVHNVMASCGTRVSTNMPITAVFLLASRGRPQFAGRPLR